MFHLFLQAMWLMLQQKEPDNFVIAMNETHSVREFVEAAFAFVNMKIRWEGSGLNEVGIEETTNTVRVRVNPKYFRPTEVVTKIRISNFSSDSKQSSNFLPITHKFQFLSKIILERF